MPAVAHTPAFTTHPVRSRLNKPLIGRILVCGALLFWVFVSLFPIYWTLNTSFKVVVDVTQGHLVPWWDFRPDWKGWRSFSLSPDTIFATSNVRDDVVLRFENGIIMSAGTHMSPMG